jgi:hypothetical protein
MPTYALSLSDLIEIHFAVSDIKYMDRLVNRPDRLVDRPDRQVDRPDRVVDRPDRQRS